MPNANAMRLDAVFVQTRMTNLLDQREHCAEPSAQAVSKALRERLGFQQARSTSSQATLP